MEHKLSMGRKQVHIVGGGTISHVRSHFALCAPAYGQTARVLEQLCRARSPDYVVNLHVTKMASGGKGNLETNEDVGRLIDQLIAHPDTKMIFFNPALVDYRGSVWEPDVRIGEMRPRQSGKYQTRLNSREQKHPDLRLEPNDKIISRIRKERKDIYLVGFKETTGATEDQQYLAGLNLLKEAACNLVLANDNATRTNMIIVPEEARYSITKDRIKALTDLVDMAYLRSTLTFTRSHVIPGEGVPWSSPLIPTALRTVVDHCIEKGAYKPFRGSTAGHFAVKVDEKTFLTSRRKTNFNQLNSMGLIQVETRGVDEVIAYGGKPSVGGQSQRIVFKEHPEYDCIVHFHCPPKSDARVPTVAQRPYECGSHECGKNTSRGLEPVDNLNGDVSVVYLDNHGPNIVFHSSIDPGRVIAFIDENFDLSQKTGGLVG